jgi:hypothetical protein
MAESQTSTHDVTTAALADQVDTQRPPDGPKLFKGQQLDTVDKTAASKPTPLFSDGEMGEFRSRWSNIQTGFVDEPRRTVEDADKLVASVMQATRGRVRERAIGVGKALGSGQQRIHRGLTGCATALSFIF